jgi:integrase
MTHLSIFSPKRDIKGTALEVISKCKGFMNEAVDRKLTSNLQFRNRRFKKLEEESENIYLTTDRNPGNLQTRVKRRSALDRVRDLFVVACNTGLRFSDLVKLKSENIINDGLQIKIATQKTGEQSLSHKK